MDRPINPEGGADLRASLEAAGWRLTRQRAAVYDHLRQADHHPTAEDVYRRVKATVPSISLATVYKALEALVDSGLASKLVASNGSARYDARSDHHYHLRCLRSGEVEDLPTDFDPDLIAKIDPGLGRSSREKGSGSPAIAWNSSAITRSRPPRPRTPRSHERRPTGRHSRPPR